MKFFKSIRITTWWFKLPPFLVLIYSYFIKENIGDIRYEIFLISFLLTGLVIGAVFASFINNYFDQEDDAIAGKYNSMINLSKNYQIIILVGIFLSGVLFSIFLISNFYAFVFYWSGWFCFYLYSSKLFRLKERAYYGIICDGLASQFFPSLFLFSFLYNEKLDENLTFVISGSVWMMFSFGMRSLIIHQYNDFENDMKSGVDTFVTNSSMSTKNIFKAFVLVVEIISFFVFIYSINSYIFIIAILFYLIFILVLNFIFDIKFYFFAPLLKERCRSVFFDLYLTILPFTLLVFLTLNNYINIVLLILSIILFNVPTFLNSIKFFKLK